MPYEQGIAEIEELGEGILEPMKRAENALKQVDVRHQDFNGSFALSLLLRGDIRLSLNRSRRYRHCPVLKRLRRVR